MENNQLIPFERNRYYVGKLLTSADFHAEQTYFNNKRRFVNSLMFGPGVVCGLNVYNLDDLSVMVESGVAVDGQGREIVLESTVVKKLSAVEGFESLTGDRALLCLRYAEEAVHPVYAVSRQEQGEEYELNRIREGYTLFLTDAPGARDAAGAESEFLVSARLRGDADYAVELSVPARVSCGAQVKLVLTATRLCDAPKALSLDCLLQTPAFTDGAGSHETHLRIEDAAPDKGGRVVREFWLRAQDEPVADSVLIALAESTRISVGGEDRRLADNVLLKLGVEDLPPEELVARAAGSINLESRDLAGTPEHIALAELGLQRTKNAYLIDSLSEAGVKTYIPTSAGEALRRAYAAWFAPAPAARQDAPAAASAASESRERYPEPMYATGVCEIPLDLNVRRGQTVYSDEIMHGLGRGDVYVQVGFEYLADDAKLRSTAKNTIYGDPQLFPEGDTPVVFADTAVKVMNDRGSFVVAARITKETNQVLLLLRWVAIKLPLGSEQTKLQRLAGRSIAAMQPTVVLGTRESHFFDVRFRNMEPCTLSYEVTEKNAGEITSDGIYTAPAREGVYEIRISCADTPLICTYAYAVVKKKDAEPEPETPAQ